MAERLTPDLTRKLMAVGAAAVVVWSGGGLVQLAVIAFAAPLGYWLCRHTQLKNVASFNLRYGARTGGVLLAVFSILLVAALFGSSGNPLVSVVSGFYRAGSLVFGGGHVVLPLLKDALVAPGWIGTDEFLAGYGAAQAVPGPMFSLAAFFGARLGGGYGGLLGAGLCLLAIFVPGLLLAAGALPFWRQIADRDGALGAIAGVNAAVVGVLAAALYDPLWVNAVFSAADLAIAVVGFVLLASTRVSVLLVIGWCVVASLARLW